jgi:hypothetical protein
MVCIVVPHLADWLLINRLQQAAAPGMSPRIVTRMLQADGCRLMQTLACLRVLACACRAVGDFVGSVGDTEAGRKGTGGVDFSNAAGMGGL